jgi:hypothetical protein
MGKEAKPASTGFPTNLRPVDAALTGYTGGLGAAPAKPAGPAAPAKPAGPAGPAGPTAPAGPTTGYTPPKDADQLRGRQGLAAEMKSYIDSGRQISKVDADRMKETGASLGLNAGNLSKLYGKYKADQPLGATSSLAGSVGKLGETRSLGTESGAMRREARRLRKQGYSQASEQMAGAASAQRLNEPSILTQEQRGRMGIQAQESERAAQDAAAAQAEQAAYMRNLYRARQKQLDGGRIPDADAKRYVK